MDLLAEAEKYTVDSNEVVEFKMGEWAFYLKS
jgi:hypothetical protein